MTKNTGGKTGSVQTPKLPHPASNLGDHLKAPKSGEIVTEHRWPKA